MRCSAIGVGQPGVGHARDAERAEHVGDHAVEVVHQPPPDEHGDDRGDHVREQRHASQEVAAREAVVQDQRARDADHDL
jgi:hypothetical protein